MGIVRAMKHHTSSLHCRLGSLALLLALSPLAAASAPPGSAAAAPASSGAPGAAPSADAKAKSPPAPISNEQAGYLFGLTFGEQLRGIGVSSEITPDAVARGIKDGLQGKKSTAADRQQVQEFARTMITAQQARNQKAAQDFLASNGAKAGVKTTASGLQYKVIAPGDAKAPAVVPTDQVTVNYRGTLIDGTEFDSSYSRGTPATVPVNGVIRGWQEALVLMKPGAKWELYVPPELAYGPQPRPGIPSNSLLIFQVELISAKAKEGPQDGAPPGGAPAPKQKPTSP